MRSFTGAGSRRDPRMDNSQAYGDQLDSLLEISAEIASLHQLAAVEDRALAYCLELTDSEFGFIGLPDARGDSMIVHAIKGFAPPPGFRDRYGFMSIRPSVFGITLLDGEPRISNDVVHDPLSVGQPPGHPPVKCFIGIPLKVGGTLIGMMGAANRPGGYGSDEERLLSTFANQVAIAIDNARLYDQQREMITRLVSVVDLATGVRPRGLPSAHVSNRGTDAPTTRHPPKQPTPMRAESPTGGDLRP